MQVVYASRLYVIQTIKKNSIADIRISFMLFFGKLFNQYKQDWQNPEYIFEKYPEFRKYPENWHPCYLQYSHATPDQPKSCPAKIRQVWAVLGISGPSQPTVVLLDDIFP